MSTQWRQSEPAAWQRVAAARARGEEPAPEDVEEAQRRARRDDAPAWARQVAAKVTGRDAAEPELVEPKPRSEFERRLAERLGVVEDPGPPAA